jgi:hypothetical protein
MKKCNYCNKEVEGNFNHHVRWECDKYKEIINSIEKKDLMEMYYEKEMTIEEIKDFYGFSHQTVINRLFKKFNIKKRKLNDTTLTKNRLKKQSKTNQERYGYAHNFEKDSSSRKKWEKRLLEEEGIENVFQREDVKEKTKKTLIKRYGKTHPMFVDEFKDKMIQTKIERDSFGSFRGSQSELQKDVINELRKNFDNVKTEYFIFVDDENINRSWFSYDVLINNKIIIEVNGDYWHCNPKFYKENDIIKFPRGMRKVKDVWEEDNLKIDFAKRKKFSIFVLWENNLKEDFNGTIKKILNEINNGKSKN